MNGDFYIDLSAAAIDGIAADLEYVAEAGALIVRDHIVLGMDPGPARTGETYRVPGTKTNYTASAPGEPPAVREGHYRDSWKTEPAVRTTSTVEAAAYTDEMVGEYFLGEILEHGTNDIVNYGVKMEPRPHIEPGIDAAMPDLNKLIADVNAAAAAP